MTAVDPNNSLWGLGSKIGEMPLFDDNNNTIILKVFLVLGKAFTHSLKL